MDNRVFLPVHITAIYRSLITIVQCFKEICEQNTFVKRPKGKLLSANYTGRTIEFPYLEVTVELPIYRTLKHKIPRSSKNTEQANPSNSHFKLRNQNLPNDHLIKQLICYLKKHLNFKFYELILSHNTSEYNGDQIFIHLSYHQSTNRRGSRFFVLKNTTQMHMGLNVNHASAQQEELINHTLYNAETISSKKHNASSNIIKHYHKTMQQN